MLYDALAHERLAMLLPMFLVILWAGLNPEPIGALAGARCHCGGFAGR